MSTSSFHWPPAAHPWPEHLRAEEVFVFLCVPGHRLKGALLCPAGNWIGGTLLAALLQARLDGAGVVARVHHSGELNHAALLVRAAARGPALRVMMATLESLHLLAFSLVGWMDYGELVPRIAHPLKDVPALTLEDVAGWLKTASESSELACAAAGLSQAKGTRHASEGSDSI